MTSIKDDRGFNQGFKETPSTIIRFERRAEEIISEIDNATAKQILEIGCGTGRIAYYIAQKTGMNVLGTDLCRPFIEEAKTKYQLPNLRFEVLDFNDPVGVAARKFDYIVGNGVLHHLYYNLDIALKTIFNLLNQQGEMIFWEPNIYNPYCALIFNIPYFRTLAHLEPTEMAFSKRFIAGKLSNAGFKEISVIYKDFLIPGVPKALIEPLIVVGNILEPIPLINTMAQSLFLKAAK